MRLLPVLATSATALLLPLLVAAVPPGPSASPAPAPSDAAAPSVDPSVDCPAPQPGTLTLATEPWTIVAIDGVVVGSTPLYRHELAAGPHQLSLHNDARHVAVFEEVVIDEGRAHKLKLLLASSAGEAVLDDAAAPAEVDCIADDAVAFVTVDTRPWSRVFVDGRLAGVTPVFQHKVAAGAHAVVVQSGAGLVRAARFTASPGETVKVVLTLAADAPPAPSADATAAAEPANEPADDGLDVR